MARAPFQTARFKRPDAFKRHNASEHTPGTARRAIERIYGEQSGPQVCDLLRKNPAVAVPIILPRLEQKDAEWMEVGGRRGPGSGGRRAVAWAAWLHEHEQPDARWRGRGVTLGG